MAKCIMVQGTMSNSGKSFIVAGLCRIFKNAGYKVAPFKSQNMALNSYITKEGLEIGRAQAMQAEAAGTLPSIYMNPILLKPTSDTGSQVIINGRVFDNMSAKDYYQKKKDFIPVIMEAYKKLEREYDIIVIEGAGSPAEINLSRNDIVNMGLANLVDAPVLLVGDIDRGGVFASLYGTVCMTGPDKNRIKGFIINKFRGDKQLLEPAFSQMREYLKRENVEIPFIGTIPMKEIDIEDEDSLSHRLQKKNIKEDSYRIVISVIRLPHISNFTDFLSLEIRKDVILNYITTPDEAGISDLVIIPGSKNTVNDMEWLRDNGFEKGLKEFVNKGGYLFGVCGGYQMLGKSIEDPLAVEHGGSTQGLGFFNMRTVFSEEKITRKTRGKIINIPYIKDCEVKGYEIHMGETLFRPKSHHSDNEQDNRPMIELSDTFDGQVKDRIFGTYLHGIFDNDDFCDKLLWEIADKRNKKFESQKMCYDEYKNEQYEVLADLLLDSLDMKQIYKIMNLNENGKEC